MSKEIKFGEEKAFTKIKQVSVLLGATFCGSIDISVGW